MRVFKKARNQKAVLWACIGIDGYGKPCLADPVEILCRWENVQEEFISPDGVRQFSVAVVYPDRKVPVGSVMWEGELKDLETIYANGAKDNPEAAEVQQYASHPNFKNTDVWHVCHLGGKT